MNRQQEKREMQRKAEAEYKKIAQELAILNRTDNPKVIQELITEHLKKTQNLYPIIRKRLSGSAADAKHLKQLIHLSSITAKRINSTARPFDIHKIIVSLKREFGEKFRDHILNNCATYCFKTAPTFEFFYGAIRSDAPEIKPRVKRARIVTTQDKNIRSAKATERDIQTECEQDSTPKEVESIYKKIKELTTSDPKREVKLLPALVDPNSFTQTVENIFHTAFLVKEGRVGIKKGDDDKPVLTDEQGTSECGPTHGIDRQSRQSIFSFSMADYNKWISRTTDDY